MRYGLIPVLAAGAALICAGPAMAKGRGSQSFLEHAIAGDMAEVQLGKLAQEKGGSQEVRDFGKTLETDHSAAQQQATSVAQAEGVTPPTAPPKMAQREYDKLSKLSGKRFDREFLNMAVKEHQKDIREFSKEAKQKQDGQVAQLAEQTLPTLKKHLEIAQSLQKGAK